MTDSSQTDVTREQLIEGLQGDLAREYTAIIQYVIFSQKLDDARYMTIADELAVHAQEELNHALGIAGQLDYLGAYPTHEPKPVWVSEKNEEMLWYDLYAEDDTVEGYRERIRQAQTLGEFALVDVLQGFIREEQDHQDELATALGTAPDARQREGEGPGRPESH